MFLSKAVLGERLPAAAYLFRSDTILVSEKLNVLERKLPAFRSLLSWLNQTVLPIHELT